MATKKDPKALAAKYNLTLASKLPDIEFVPTGFSELDELLRPKKSEVTGGFPRKRITELYGLQSVGKTSLTLKAIAGATAAGWKTLFIDCERAFNKERAAKLGVDLEKLMVAEESTLEVVSDIILDNLDKFDLIIVDSVAAMVPRAEIEGEAGDAVIALKARLLGQLLRKATAPLGNSKCALVFINQLRENLEMFTAKYSTPGGMAMKFTASLRIEMKTTAKDRITHTDKSTGEIVRSGHWITATIDKSKVGRPHQSTRFKLMYD